MIDGDGPSTISPALVTSVDSTGCRATTAAQAASSAGTSRSPSNQSATRQVVGGAGAELGGGPHAVLGGGRFHFRPGGLSAGPIEVEQAGLHHLAEVVLGELGHEHEPAGQLVRREPVEQEACAARPGSPARGSPRPRRSPGRAPDAAARSRPPRRPPGVRAGPPRPGSSTPCGAPDLMTSLSRSTR